MTDVPRIEGIPDPRKSSQLSSDDSVDADKFKRILKVEDTDESQKESKKKKSQKQEEEEELNKKEGDKNIPKDASFSTFFGETKKKEDPFAIKGVEKKAISVSSTDAELSKSPFELSASSKRKKTAKAYPSLNFEEALPKAFSVSLKDKPPHKTPHLEPAKIEEPTIATEEVALLKKEGAELSNTETALSNAPPPATPFVFIPASGQEITKESGEKIGSLSPKEASLSEDDHHKKKEEEKEDYVPLATPAQIMTPPLLQTETPVYATLPSQVYELFEKMIGLMMIQEYKGVSITTIKLSMPGSVFNGCEIKLEHYDTAPHAFNIQLLGNPDAVELFNANFDGLVNSFKQTKYSFQANVRRPVLLETYHSFSRKKGAGSNDNDNSSQSEHAS